MKEMYVLSVPSSINLGYIRTAVARGAVIEVDRENSVVRIDGRVFNDLRDIDILLNQSRKNPQAPWLTPLEDTGAKSVKAVPARKSPVKPRAALAIVNSDEDEHEPIDATNTQISRIASEKKEAERNANRIREINNDMDIIRADEGMDERLARIGKVNTIQAMEAAIDATMSKRIPVVEDDGSHGIADSSAVSLNEGSVMMTQEAIDARAALSKGKANAAKVVENAPRKRGRPRKSAQ